MSNIGRLINIMDRLRSPGGCPWDQQQTHQSLKPYLIEEAYEVLEAIDRGQDDAFVEELGDLLLQVVFHAQIAREAKRFSMEDVAGAISEKLIRRHPHVFGDTNVENADQVVKNWDTIKAQEKKRKGKEPSVLDGVPRHLPALLRARRLQERAARVGFDWEDSEEVADKIREEVSEFLEARSSGSPEEIQEEFGDLLFSLVNLARFIHVCPEEALTQTNDKFLARFSFVETELKKAGKQPKTATLAEMDALWEKAKSQPNRDAPKQPG